MVGAIQRSADRADYWVRGLRGYGLHSPGLRQRAWDEYQQWAQQLSQRPGVLPTVEPREWRHLQADERDEALEMIAQLQRRVCLLELLLDIEEAQAVKLRHRITRLRAENKGMSEAIFGTLHRLERVDAEDDH